MFAVEPRYDYASQQMAVLIYALRRCLPNHFQYNDSNGIDFDVQCILEELAESHKDQSEMDNESPSALILEVIERNFDNLEIKYSTAFFDKFIGGIRTDDKDTQTLSKILKQLDEIILKYNPDFARTVMIKAGNEH